MSAFVVVIVVISSFGASTTTIDMPDSASCLHAAKMAGRPGVSAFCVDRKTKE